MEWKKVLISESGKSELRILKKKYLPKELINQVEEEIEDLKLDHKPSLGNIFGKERFSPRDVGFFSDEVDKYSYSKSSRPAKPLLPEMKKLLKWINKNLCKEVKFNGILVNRYEDGKSYIGKHSDDEKELIPDVGVIALSFGATRKFRIRDKKSGKIIIDVPAKDGELIWMWGNFQKEYTHEIPIESKITEERISYTFRYHNKKKNLSESSSESESESNSESE